MVFSFKVLSCFEPKVQKVIYINLSITRALYHSRLANIDQDIIYSHVIRLCFCFFFFSVATHLEKAGIFIQSFILHLTSVNSQKQHFKKRKYVNFLNYRYLKKIKLGNSLITSLFYAHNI